MTSEEIHDNGANYQARGEDTAAAICMVGAEIIRRLDRLLEHYRPCILSVPEPTKEDEAYVRSIRDRLLEERDDAAE